LYDSLLFDYPNIAPIPVIEGATSRPSYTDFSLGRANANYSYEKNFSLTKEEIVLKPDKLLMKDLNASGSKAANLLYKPCKSLDPMV
jgi:hypothetical protein